MAAKASENSDIKKAPAQRIRAVFFDLGGVVFDSPVNAIRAFEKEKGLPKDCINRAFAKSPAWDALERGLIGTDTFSRRIVAEKNVPRQLTENDFRSMMKVLSNYTLKPRRQMVEAILRLKAQGYYVGAITNNWNENSSKCQSAGMPFENLRSVTQRIPTQGLYFSSNPHIVPSALFHDVVESSVEGVRKPHPAIYRLACKRLHVAITFYDHLTREKTHI
jgi:putative hydrolase of the HAD superfamily